MITETVTPAEYAELESKSQIQDDVIYNIVDTNSMAEKLTEYMIRRQKIEQVLDKLDAMFSVLHAQNCITPEADTYLHHHTREIRFYLGEQKE